MNRTLKLTGTILFIVAGLLFVWYFSNIVFYILTAAVLSVIGRPVVHFLDSLKIGKLRFPHNLSTILTLLLMILIALSLVAVFVPLIAQQARDIASIDANELYQAFEGPIAALNSTLRQVGVLQPGQGVQEALLGELHSIASIATFANAFNYIISFTGSFFMSAFSILFISFFFLKDEKLFLNAFMLLIPVKYHESATRILNEVKRLLTRYFLGLCLEVVSMITLISLGLTIFGVRNALLIGFIGGLMNIIPYLGPLIGGAIGIIIGITGSLSMGAYASVLPLSLSILGVFAGANLVDNILLQPVVYSTSVKAHPIEIFLVIIVAGSLFGITGMILAVPAYTVIRVVLREFFSEMRLVQKLTEKM